MNAKIMTWFGFATVLVLLALSAAQAAQPLDVKNAIKCRKTITGELAKVIKEGLKVQGKCHKDRNKGKVAQSVDCNDLDVADLAGKYASKVGKADEKIAKKCVPETAVLDNYPPDGDVIGVVEPGLAEELESSGDELLGGADLTGSDKPTKAKQKCQGEVDKNRSKLVDKTLKGVIKCQNDLDKTATSEEDFQAVSGACVVVPQKEIDKARTSIAKKCSGIAPADIGATCPGDLGDCVVDSATGTSESISRSVYGLCGNGDLDGVEECDDGDQEDGDGCDSNCTVTACGNGIATSGEECDDGNDSDNDACVSTCEEAVCGDSHVHVGVERCGDAPPAACANPTLATCATVECGTPSGSTHAVVVSFDAAPGRQLGGLSVLLDYREEIVRIPGTADAQSVRDRVVLNVTSQLTTFSERDFEFGLSVTNTSAPFTEGELFRATLDACEGQALPALDQYACVVVAASTLQGGVVPVDDVTCSLEIAP